MATGLLQPDTRISDVFMVAGEASADHHGAKIVAKLKTQGIVCFGVGGPKMRAAGFVAIATAEEISVMGFFEVVRELPRILGVLRRLKQAIVDRQPKVAVLIDLPDFNLRLARFLKDRHIPIVYYISPQVWAWRQRRVKQIRRLIDDMLCVLPFEPAFYAARQVHARFVGHPLVEDLRRRPDGASLRRELGLGQSTVIGLLPGSRRQESKRLLPVLLAAANRLVVSHPDVKFVIPLAGTTSGELVTELVAGYPEVQKRLQTVDGRAQEVLALSTGAAVASGTATLEAALVGTPFVGLYKMSWLSFVVARKLIGVASILLANLILGETRIQELLQGDASPEHIADHLTRFLDDRSTNTTALTIRDDLLAKLGEQAATDEVVAAVVRHLDRPGSPTRAV